MLVEWTYCKAILLLTLTATWCQGDVNYSVKKVYNLCKPDDLEYQPPTVYIPNTGISTEVFVNVLVATNKTQSVSCRFLFKTCSSCHFQVDRVDEDFDYSTASVFLENEDNYDPSECLNDAIYLSLYDNYYKSVKRVVTKSDLVNGFMSDSSQLSVIGCINKMMSVETNITMRLKLTSVEKIQVITVDASEPLPQRTFTSPNFPSPYVANSEIYKFTIQSFVETDYIAISFDDWIVSPLSTLIIQGANVEKVTGDSGRPYIVSNGPIINITFNTGTTLAGSYYSYLGFKAVAKFYKHRYDIPLYNTDCGEFITSEGGIILLSGDGSLRDCVWVIKKMPQYFGVSINILQQYQGQGEANNIEVRNGLTSNKKELFPVPGTTSSWGRLSTFYKSDVGFYIRIQGNYYDLSTLAGAYAMYNEGTDCSDTRTFFKCISGRCIMESFKCDNYDHCGDNSDETTFLCNTNTIGGSGSSPGGSSSYSIGIGVIIPMVVSVFLVIVICLLIIFIRRCRRLNNSAFGSQPGMSSQQQNRGNRRRRHNHVQMSLTVSSGEHPPSYDEVIQNTPIGYLNMAFSWSQTEPGVAQPPSYEDSLLPASSAATAQTASPGAAPSTASLSSTQHLAAPITRSTLHASLDPGAYVSSSSSSSEDASDHDNPLNTSSSSDSSTDVENGMFPTGGAGGQRARSNIDVSKTMKVSLEPKSRNSLTKPASESICVELSELAFTKEKSDAHKILSKSMSNLQQISKDENVDDRLRHTQIHHMEPDKNKLNTIDSKNIGREGMYVKKSQPKSSKPFPVPDSTKSQKISDSSRSRSCFDLHLGGAVGGCVPSSSELEGRNEDKRFSYAGYGDVSLKNGDHNPFSVGRGLVRDKPLENLSKFTTTSCDNLLQDYEGRKYPGQFDYNGKQNARSRQDNEHQKESIRPSPTISSNKAVGYIPEEDGTKSEQEAGGRWKGDHPIVNNPRSGRPSSTDVRPKDKFQLRDEPALKLEAPISESDKRLVDNFRGKNIPVDHKGAKTSSYYHPESSAVGTHKKGRAANQAEDQMNQQKPRPDTYHPNEMADRPMNQTNKKNPKHSCPEPIYQTPKQSSDGLPIRQTYQPEGNQSNVNPYKPEKIYQTPKVNSNQMMPSNRRQSEPIYDTPQLHSGQSRVNSLAPGSERTENVRQKPVPAPRQGSKKNSSSTNKPVPVARSLSTKPNSSAYQSNPASHDLLSHPYPKQQSDNYAAQLRQASGEITESHQRAQRQGSTSEDNQNTSRDHTVLTLDPTFFNSSERDVFI